MLIDRLEEPATAMGALVEMQTYLDDAGADPINQVYARNKRSLLQREDVAEAIAEIGRIESFDVWRAAY